MKHSCMPTSRMRTFATVSVIVEALAVGMSTCRSGGRIVFRSYCVRPKMILHVQGGTTVEKELQVFLFQKTGLSPVDTPVKSEKSLSVLLFKRLSVESVLFLCTSLHRLLLLIEQA